MNWILSMLLDMDKGRKKRAKQAVNKRFRRIYKQNEKNYT